MLLRGMSDTNEPEVSDEAPGATPVTDPGAAAILDQLAGAKLAGSVSPEDVARAVAEARRKASDPPDLWRRYLSAVKQQAIHLARAGEV